MRIRRGSAHLTLCAARAALLAAVFMAGAMLLTPTPVGADPAAPAGPDPVDTAQGAIPPGVTLGPFDIAYPAVAGLDPALRSAVQEAAQEAGAAGVELRITSGWRSDALQRRMLDDAVYTYGSFDAARKWVALPEVSRHVTGGAVDIGPPAAAQWLLHNGPRFGLCQVYANEPWHFELTGDGFGGCPPLLPNAAA